ncbi:MAG: coproporphyrinogen dehydrogenase HemZ [Ruminococcus sp.]|nr:coproporphyrinogen dehydrogenase HemZ [Ruminococcus sp.]
MRLIFSGNDYKYEIEAIMKLFLPAQRFNFSYDEKNQTFEEDFAFIRKKVTKKHTLLYVIVQIGADRRKHSIRISANADDNECEMQLSRLLYCGMSELTGISSKWGVLTGVRPVKQIHRLIDEGLDEDEIFNLLQAKYFVAPDKCKIAYNTALTQKPILEKIKQTQNKAFGLYISIPFCPSRCSYCSFISQSASGTAVKKLIPTYIENLCAEIKHTGKIIEKLGLKANTVYFGGGTPTTLSAQQLKRIMNTISESFDLSYVTEYTIEAGRPDTITEDKLATILENGCTRISINPQTLNDNVLEQIGRNHTATQFFNSFRLAREVGFTSINTDIIAGLPTDTTDSFKYTVDELVRLAPESITVHTLSIKRSARLNSKADKKSIMKNPASEMVDYATSRLYENGYKPYYLYKQKNMIENLENIGWVKPGHESLYNILIMEEVQTIIALGANGSTKLIDNDGGRLERVYNYKYPLDYNNNFEIMLDRKKRIEEFYAKE